MDQRDVCSFLMQNNPIAHCVGSVRCSFNCKRMDKDFTCFVQQEKQDLASRIDLKKIKPIVNKYMPLLSPTIADPKSESSLDFYDELCKLDCETFYMFLKILKEGGYEIEAEWMQNYLQSPLHYEMKSNGLCLIINNVEFSSSKQPSFMKGVSKRTGSEKDERAMMEVLQNMGYEFVNKKNLTAEEMKKALLEFSEHFNGDFNHDSLIVIILTHGTNVAHRDVLYGTDWEPIFKENIYEMFSNMNCQNMQGKPKMFFFQACRGELHYSQIEPSNDEFVSDTSPPADSLVLTTRGSEPQPKTSDMIVVHSALPDYTCHRSKKGSIFCQTLAKVFKRDYRRNDLNAMLVCVSREMEKIPGKEEFIHIEYLGNFGIVQFC